MRKIIPKLIYVPVIGIFIAFMLVMSEKWEDTVFIDDRKIILFMVMHVVTPAILWMIYNAHCVN